MPNILICDDERSICEMLDITLRREGYKVETVNSGEAGLKKLDSALFDVVITDIRMPNVNGIEVLRHAHRRAWLTKSNLPFAAYSSESL
jgi:CheY-like chemotaxis protein